MRLRRFPASIPETAGAKPGPSVDGTPVFPGDCLHGTDGATRVVVGTGFGTENDGLRLFDPVAGELCQPVNGWTTLETEQWSLQRLSLGVATTLGPDKQTQYLLTAGYDPARNRATCLLGETTVGGMYARIADELVVESDPTTLGVGLRDVPRRTVQVGKPPETVAALVENIAEQIEVCIEHRLAGPGETEKPSLTTDAVEIPTGRGDPVWTAPSGRTLAPGDRLVELPTAVSGQSSPAEELAEDAPCSIDNQQIRAGGCTVVLRQPSPSIEETTKCFELVDGERETLGEASLASRYRNASERGYVLELLARDSFVDPIGTAKTYSIHCYEVPGDSGPRFLLAGARRETSTPVLEHPLTVPCEGFESRVALAGALQNPSELSHPLRSWASESSKVNALCHRVSQYINTTEIHAKDSYKGL